VIFMTFALSKTAGHRVESRRIPDGPFFRFGSEVAVFKPASETDSGKVPILGNHLPGQYQPAYIQHQTRRSPTDGDAFQS
jgi:hypothetical protein